MSIQLLDKDTVNKIAAGEVIERPMAVVKELLENAIDAGASSVTVEIKDGGKSLVRVTDNGSGIDSEDIKLAFMPHATSKIKQLQDLLSISTLGFRGEALASIASVSQLEMLTKTRKSFSGSRYVIEGGAEKSFTEAGCPDGTTFIVHNLFYNTPARLKFLKTSQTEAGYISSMVEYMALSHPDISFRFINQNQPRFCTSGNGKLKDVIYNIYGKDITTNLFEINAVKESCQISGFIGKPVISRGNRGCINYFVNGRYIKSNIINHAIEEAYSGYMMNHKYPFVVLDFKTDPGLIDINVHPQKMEIRFTNEKELYSDIYNVVSETLKYKELIPEVTFDKSKKNSKDKTADTSQGKKIYPVNSQTGINTAAELKQKEKGVILRAPSPEETSYLFRTGDNSTENKKGVEDIKKEETELRETAAYNAHNIKQETLFGTDIMPAKSARDIKIIGQVFSTYWILQYGDSMYIIDQHAAHEKVLYERFMKQIENNQPFTQMLNPPVVASLSMAEQQVLEENANVFKKLGYIIENFGGREYMLSGVPAHLPDIEVKELFLEILDGLLDNKAGITPETLLSHVASMSCKAAVKGGSSMAEPQAHELLKELMALENPYNCPHGRPVLVKITKRELERKFKRIL